MLNREDMQTSQSWRHLTWDAMLPIAIAISPFLVRCCFRNGHIVEVVIAVISPVLAAFLRGAVGIHQLEAACNGNPSWGRQALFAGGICLLLLVEVFVSTLQFTDNEPLATWFFPAGLFCFYLSAMQHALAPVEEAEESELDPYFEF